MTATTIAALLAGRGEDMCRLLLPNGRRNGAEWCVGSLAGEPGDSLKVCLSGQKVGVWRDFAGGADDGGDPIGLWQRVRGVDLRTACTEALAWLGIADTDSRTTTRTTKRAQHRPPDLQRGTFAEVRALAALRGFPSWVGLEILIDRRQLYFAAVRDGAELVRAWFVTDASRRNLQARRCDGQPWHHLPGGPKAWTWPGSQASWPIGAADIGDRRAVALVEGGPDLLAAAHFAFLEGVHERIALVCMAGASNRIPDDALPAFRACRVRIFVHADAPGAKAGARWAAQLRSVAADVDGFCFDALSQPDGTACKDLADLATWPVESWCTSADVERDARGCGSEGPTLGPATPNCRRLFVGMRIDTYGRAGA